MSATPMTTTAVPGDRLDLGAVSWSLFEAGRNPFVMLVTIYVFMPYFSTVMVGDPVKGQALVATYGQWAGWIIALTAPLLGASIDRIGPRKPLLLVSTLVMAVLMMSLWWARPDMTGLGIGGVVVAATLINVLFGYTEVLHNAMLAQAAGHRLAHKASGLGLALSNAVSVLVLVFVLWAFALPGKVPWGWIPAQPLFGMDPAAHEPERIVGPIAGVLCVLGALPMFLFTPDAARTGNGIARSLREGLRTLLGMVGKLRGHRDMTAFLLARMLYVDAMTAVLLFSGVYAAGVMKWHTLTMLSYGVLLSVFAALGGILGSRLDAALGPKVAVRIEVLMTLVGLVCVIGMAPERILYFWHYDAAAAAPLWNGPFFRTWPDLLYLLIGFSNAAFITASYSSSRTLLLRLSPPGESGAFFGIFALSGTATMWLGSFLVHYATATFHSQQAGMGAIVVLMSCGWIGMCFVRGGGRLAPHG